MYKVIKISFLLPILLLLGLAACSVNDQAKRQVSREEVAGEPVESVNDQTTEQVLGKEVTDEPVEKAVSAVGLDLSDPKSIASWTANIMAEGDFRAIKQLIGDTGASILPYAMGFRPPGYNNGKEISETFAQAIAGSRPTCRGWRVDDYQLHLIFSNAYLKEEVIGFDPGETDVVQFLFIKEGSQFKLAVIGPVSNWGGWEIEYELTGLTACR